jgi:hypothetical protein
LYKIYVLPTWEYINCKIEYSYISIKNIVFKKILCYNVCYIKQICIYLHVIINIKTMKRPLLPKNKRMLADMGNQIKLARLRRNITSQELADRASLGRNTIVNIEAGDESVSFGNYFRVLIALGLSNDILMLAKDDVLGRKLQDAELVTPKRVRNS